MGVSRILSRIFCLTLPKTFIVEPLLCHYFPPSKKLMFLRVLSRFSVDIFLPHKTEAFRRVTIMCCVSEKIWYREKIMDKREGEMSRFSFENFLSQRAEKFRRGTPYRVTDFGYRKILCLRRLCHDFLSTFFVSGHQKTLRGTLFAVFRYVLASDWLYR